MKKRFLFVAQSILLGLFIVSLLATALQLLGRSNPLAKFGQNTAVYNHIEDYDPSLVRLDRIDKVEQYCDSVYAKKELPAGAPVDFERNYTEVVSSIIRNRFYHGYSYYSLADNYVGKLAATFTMPGLSALVIPNEILKFPYAACSQQSIVMMEVLQNKGLKTRKVSFQGTKFGGHFAFEVFYDDAWHFFDPNMEPDVALLNSYGRPGIDFLVRNPAILVKAYHRELPEKTMDIFPNYSYGPVNKFPAPRAIVFQKATRFLSYSIWLFFLAGFIIVRRKYLRTRDTTNAKAKMNSGIRLQQEKSPGYYPDYSAQSN